MIDRIRLLVFKFLVRLASWVLPSSEVTNLTWRHSLRHWLIYHQREVALKKVYWMGVRTLKNVQDLWIYQEILHEVRPEIIVEVGSYAGGSTLYLAHLLDSIGQGQVFSIDIDRDRYQASHSRIKEITGDSLSEEVIGQVAELVRDKTTLVILDSDHHSEHVLKEMSVYGRFVTPNSYLIVEDGVVDLIGPEMGWDGEDGPLAAIDRFLQNNTEFMVDHARERYFVTYNPRGYLKRTAPQESTSMT